MNFKAKNPENMSGVIKDRIECKIQSIHYFTSS